MGSWLRPLGAAAVLFLAGCSADYGVDQDGRPVAAEQLDGHWLVVNYWADWCAPCRTEIPEMNRLAQVLEGQGGRVIGVNFDGLRDTELKKSADGMGIRFTVLADDPALQGPRGQPARMLLWLMRQDEAIRLISVG